MTASELTSFWTAQIFWALTSQSFWINLSITVINLPLCILHPWQLLLSGMGWWQPPVEWVRVWQHCWYPGPPLPHLGPGHPDVQLSIGNFWWNLPHQCCGHKWRCLHLYPTRLKKYFMSIWIHLYWRNFQIYMSNWHHLVPFWWPGLWDEVWKLDLQWAKGWINTTLTINEYKHSNKNDLLYCFPVLILSYPHYCYLNGKLTVL